MIAREFNQRRYRQGIVGFEVKLTWSDGSVEILDDMPEYLQDELERLCEEYDQYREENT
jgi:hypothetical protein